MEESPCKQYLGENLYFSDLNEQELEEILSKIFDADPDPGGANCKWLIDAWMKGEFKLDEDEDLVKADILEFRKLFGSRFPLPKKGYDELKIMINQKKSKSKSKSESLTMVSLPSSQSCKEYFQKQNKDLKPIDLEKIFLLIQDANPKKDYLVCVWIVNELKKGNIKVGDLKDVHKYLERFFELGYEEPPNFYPNYNNVSNYQLVKDVVDQNVKLYSYNDKEGILLEPLDFETSCYYGSEAGWCTAKEKKHFDKYSKTGPLYIWFDKNKYKNKYQFNFDSNELKNKLNSDISKEEFKYFLNHPLLKDIFERYLDSLSKGKVEKMFELASNFYPDWNYLKQISLDNAENAYYYSKFILEDRFPEGEKIILKDPTYSKRYLEELFINSTKIDPEIIKVVLDSSVAENALYNLKSTAIAFGIHKVADVKKVIEDIMKYYITNTTYNKAGKEYFDNVILLDAYQYMKVNITDYFYKFPQDIWFPIANFYMKQRKDIPEKFFKMIYSSQRPGEKDSDYKARINFLKRR